MNCCSDFSDTVSAGIDHIELNASLNPGTVYQWLITWAGGQYWGSGTADENGMLSIDAAELPAGLLGSPTTFDLQVQEVDSCKPVPLFLCKYYDTVSFSITQSNVGKSSIGCPIEELPPPPPSEGIVIDADESPIIDSDGSKIKYE